MSTDVILIPSGLMTVTLNMLPQLAPVRPLPPVKIVLIEPELPPGTQTSIRPVLVLVSVLHWPVALRLTVNLPPLV